MKHIAVRLYEIDVDGLPPTKLRGNVAFVFDGVMMTGWYSKDAHVWKAHPAIGQEMYAGVTFWVELPPDWCDLTGVK